MRVLITGAGGFVGRHVATAALQAGHIVRAVLRPSAPTSVLGPLVDDPALEVATLDLRSPVGLVDALEGVDTVIHLAAAKSGDFYTQFAATVVGTENLLAAMGAVGVKNLVGVSTFSVYDYRALRAGALLDEFAPLDTDPGRRDEYARTKLIQEELYRDHAHKAGNHVVVLRPGMVYGRDNLWHALLGAEIGPLVLRIGSRATLPLTYAENVADAMVLAAEQIGGGSGRLDGQIINIVDDRLPTQKQYIAAIADVAEAPRSLPVPWPAMQFATELLDRGNELIIGGRAKFPGFMVPDRLHARFKPLRYTNAKAKRLLGWTPRFRLDGAIARSVAKPSTRSSTEPVAAAVDG